MENLQIWALAGLGVFFLINSGLFVAILKAWHKFSTTLTTLEVNVANLTDLMSDQKESTKEEMLSRKRDSDKLHEQSAQRIGSVEKDHARLRLEFEKFRAAREGNPSIKQAKP